MARNGHWEFLSNKSIDEYLVLQLQLLAGVEVFRGLTAAALKSPVPAGPFSFKS
jgi:hypothetical protein